VQAEHQKVRALLARVTAARDAATIEKEELEFRHDVGELTDADVAEKLKAPIATLERCGTDLAAVEKEDARFVEALGAAAAPAADAPPASSPAPVADTPAAAPELAAPSAPAPVAAPPAPPPAPPTVPSPPPPAAAAKRPNAPSATTVLSPEAAAFILPDISHLTPPPMRSPAAAASPSPSPAKGKTPAPPKAPPGIQPGPAGTLDETTPMAPYRPDETRRLERGPEGKEAAGASSRDAADNPDAQTFMLPAGMLVMTPADGSPVEHRLAALNHLGRSEDNQIQIPTPGVSRRHAMVVATPTGFLIKDMGSQNGTFVNGQRIAEHTLADGDTISIGDTKLVYKTTRAK
jgi:hypothetical protein